MTESLLATAPTWVAVTVLVIAIEVVVPPILGWAAVRRLGVGWRFFWYGALVFFVSQLVIHLPLMQVGGLFAEGGRWIGYRYLFRPDQRTWPAAVVYGLGHGGLESMLLIAGVGAISLFGLLTASGMDFSRLPPEQLEAVQAQLAAVAAQPAWMPLLSAWERLSAIALHVGLSLIVLQSFRRGSLVWLLVAILCHGVVDAVGVGLLKLVGDEGSAGLLIIEVAIMAMAIVVLWSGLRLRDQADEAIISSAL
jgi:uncharacterized membrane protein YhfC